VNLFFKEQHAFLQSNMTHRFTLKVYYPYFTSEWKFSSVSNLSCTKSSKLSFNTTFV